MQDDVGSHRTVVRSRGPSGATPSTSYDADTSASLVTFAGRLAWRVRYRAVPTRSTTRRSTPRSGDVLRRGTWSSPRLPRWSGSVPGQPAGGTAVSVDLEARAGWRRARRTERAERARFQRPRRQRRGGGGRGGDADRRRLLASRSCPSPGAAATPGTCARGAAARRRPERQPRAGHRPGLLLRQPLPRPPGRAPIGFNAAAGAFEGVDPLQLNTLDGASPARTATTSTTPTCSRRRTARRRSCRCTCGARRSATSPAAATRRSSTTSTRTGSRTGS